MAHRATTRRRQSQAHARCKAPTGPRGGKTMDRIRGCTVLPPSGPGGAERGGPSRRLTKYKVMREYVKLFLLLFWGQRNGIRTIKFESSVSGEEDYPDNTRVEFPI